MEKVLTVRVKRLHPDAQLPKYAHLGNLGDLAADLFSVESFELQVGESIPVSTGIAIEPPEGFGAIIEDRSGLASKGITTLAGIIDPGYRGELKVIMTNLSGRPVTLSRGERIAQMRLVRLFQANFEEVDQLSTTSRNKEGFGSTGE
jgi:dUTP pyrophosphatase